MYEWQRGKDHVKKMAVIQSNKELVDKKLRDSIEKIEERIKFEDLKVQKMR